VNGYVWQLPAERWCLVSCCFLRDKTKKGTPLHDCKKIPNFINGEAGIRRLSMSEAATACREDICSAVVDDVTVIGLLKIPEDSI